MRFRALLVAFLPLAAALAGCAVPGASSDEPPAEPARAPPSGTEEPRDEASSEDPPRSDDPPASSGQAGGGNGSASSPPPPSSGNATQGAPPAGEPPAAAKPPGPHKREETANGKATLAVAPPCVAPETPCSAAFQADPVSLPVKEARPALATLVVEWEAKTAPLGLSFNVSTPDGVQVGAGSGASPLTLTLDAALLGGATELLVTPGAPSPGAAGNVEYALLLTLEYR